jgi:hypothetical protein
MINAPQKTPAGLAITSGTSGFDDKEEMLKEL